MQRHVFTEILSTNKILAKVVKQNLKYTSFKDLSKAEAAVPTVRDDFVSIVVSKLKTVLCVPEDVVVKQDEESYDMYFIAKGDCSVNVRDEKKNEHFGFRILKEGDHFGEISMIFKCRRSATVVSRNYNTMAMLTEESFKSLVAEYPEY